MKKSMLFAAAAVVAMVGCTNEDFTGFQNKAENGEMAINFGSGTKKLTRAENIEGAAAAELLDNNFVVLGIKSNGDLTAAAPDAQTVFDYYNVNYYANTANQTESNSANWEYVGQSVSGFATAKAQTIKYWDFAKSQYDFIAFSKGANEETIENLFSEVDLANLDTKAYTITGTLDQLKNCFVADLLTYYNSTASSDFNKTVKPVFRRMQAKLRLGFYETVPGYSVKDVKFYTKADDNAPAATPALFTKDEAKTLFIGGDAKGEMEVSFPVTGSSNVGKEGYNVANIKFTASGEGSSFVTFDELDPTKEELYEATGTEYLGRTSNTATYAGENTLTNDYAYETILPVGDGGQVLNLKVDYTLVAIDGSGEEINVVGATAQVPAIYTNWQPNYAYTYLFKISDQTNGNTNPGQDYVGLYPITFDACVMADVDGIQETITEFGKNAITTYQSKKVVTENDEYKAGKNIYVTVNNGEELTEDYWKVGAVNVFKATIGNDALQTISEASVANCIEQNYDPTNTYSTCKVTDANSATLELTKLANGTAWKLLDEIPAEDAPHGVTIETDGAKTCVAQIAAPAAGTYVFQYLETAATYKPAPFNTIVKGGTFWTLVKAPTDKGYTYTYTQTSSALGTEVWAANTYYHIAPTLGAPIDNPNTLTAGKIYYLFDGTDTYTQFVAEGDEEWDAIYYGYDVKPTLCYGNLTDNKILSGNTYFVRDGNNYKAVTASADIIVKATDKFYFFGDITTTTLVAVAQTADNAKTLAKGTTYYKDLGLTSPQSGYEEFVSDGTETWSTGTYSTSVATPATAFAENEFNTLATGSTYFINTDAEPTAKEALGTETNTGVEKVVDVMPVYYYKVIKVVE